MTSGNQCSLWVMLATRSANASFWVHSLFRFLSLAVAARGLWHKIVNTAVKEWDLGGGDYRPNIKELASEESFERGGKESVIGGRNDSESQRKPSMLHVRQFGPLFQRALYFRFLRRNSYSRLTVRLVMRGWIRNKKCPRQLSSWGGRVPPLPFYKVSGSKYQRIKLLQGAVEWYDHQIRFYFYALLGEHSFVFVKVEFCNRFCDRASRILFVCSGWYLEEFLRCTLNHGYVFFCSVILHVS